MELPTTKTSQEEKGAINMAHILCPACRTNTVPAVGWEFSQTSVKVTACADCQTAGIASMTVKVTAMADLEIATYAVRHRDGLVAFA